MPLIQTSVIEGGAVYGVPQMSYTVDGEADRDFSAALAAAAFRQTAAIEKATASYADLVRVREGKLDDLGEVLAELNKVNTTFDSDDDSGTTREVDSVIYSVGVQKYGLDISFTDGNHNKMTRGAIMNAQNEVQYAIDTEDNNLQQDLVALQSLLSKRDNAHSTAARVIRKADEAAKTTIGNIV